MKLRHALTLLFAFAVVGLVIFDYRSVTYSVEELTREGEEQKIVVARHFVFGGVSSGPKDYYANIVDVRDFDDDGRDDALVSTSNGGNCCPPYYAIVSLKGWELVVAPISEDFTEIYVVEDEKNVFVVEKGVDKKDYFLFDGIRANVVKIESSMPAIKSIRGAGAFYTDDTAPRELTFDLDENGSEDVVVCQIWDRWGSLLCSLPLPKGETQKLSHGCDRIGVLASKNNGYHDLVCNFDTVIKFNGSKWVET